MYSLLTEHPERLPDELFLGNFSNYGKGLGAEIGWISKRKGQRAYDMNGRNVTNQNLTPFFVKRKELEDNGIEII